MLRIALLQACSVASLVPIGGVVFRTKDDRAAFAGSSELVMLQVVSAPGEDPAGKSTQAKTESSTPSPVEQHSEPPPAFTEIGTQSRDPRGSDSSPQNSNSNTDTAQLLDRVQRLEQMLTEHEQRLHKLDEEHRDLMQEQQRTEDELRSLQRQPQQQPQVQEQHLFLQQQTSQHQSLSAPLSALLEAKKGNTLGTAPAPATPALPQDPKALPRAMIQSSMRIRPLVQDSVDTKKYWIASALDEPKRGRDHLYDHIPLSEHWTLDPHVLQAADAVGRALGGSLSAVESHVKDMCLDC